MLILPASFFNAFCVFSSFPHSGAGIVGSVVVGGVDGEGDVWGGGLVVVGIVVGVVGGGVVGGGGGQ